MTNPNNTPIVPPFAYLAGYNYGTQGNAILDGKIIPASRDKGVPVNTISWLKSKITDVGMDFTLLNGKFRERLTGFTENEPACRVQKRCIASGRSWIRPRRSEYKF